MEDAESEREVNRGLIKLKSVDIACTEWRALRAFPVGTTKGSLEFHKVAQRIKRDF